LGKDVLAKEKCTKLFALNVARNARFLSSLQETGLCIAKNVIERKENIETIGSYSSTGHL